MAYLESNSTHTPLMANQIFTGRAEIVNPVYITIQISFRTDVSGTLEVYHSFDGNSFSNYGDSFYFNAGNHHKQVAIKGSFIYVKYVNSNFNQTYFDLHSKLAETVREEMEVSLNSLDDSVSIPKLEQCVSGNTLNVSLGSTSDVLCYGRDSLGNNKILRLGNEDRLKVDISGVYTNLGLKVDISGQYLRADLSGSNINDVISQERLLLIHNDVSGLDSRLVTLHTDSVNIHNDVSGVDSRLNTLHTDSVNIHNDVSGVDNRLLVIHNDVSGVDNRLSNIYNSSMTIHNDVSGLDSRLVTLHTDSINIHNDVSGFRFNSDMLKVDISGQNVNLNVNDISGVSVNVATVNSGANIGARMMGSVGTGYEDIKSDGHKHLLVSITDSGESKFTSFNTDGGLNTHCVNFADISGTRVDISGQSVRITSMPSFSVTADISGQRVDISGQTVRVSNLIDISGLRVDISGQTIAIKGGVDISGQTVDISGQSLRMMGFDGVDTYNNLYVDANGFISANVLSTAHENIYLGFDTYYADYCSGSTNVGIWSKNNPNALSVDGWYCSSPASTYEVSIYTYLNHFFGAYNQSDFTFADIDTWYCVMQNWNCVNSNTMPTIRVYSATSRWDYTINAGQALNNGEAIMPYFGLLSRIKNNDTEVRRVRYSLTGGTGVRGSGENITKIEMYIPATVAEFIEMNIIEGAVYVKNKGLINYYYTNDKVGREQNDINEIRKQTDKLTFKTLTGELKVDVSGQRVDVSGQDIRVKGMWLNTDTQHATYPASLGDPNIIKSADGAISSYINGAVSNYNTSTNKLAGGNMAPINTVQTQVDSTNDFYRQSLCVRDSEMYNAMVGNGIVVGGKNAGGSFKTLRLDDNGRVDISGELVITKFSQANSDNNVKISDGSNVLGVNSYTGITNGIGALKSVNTNSALYAYNTTTGTCDVLTYAGSNVLGNVRALHTVVGNDATANTTTTGLNVYNIYPNRKSYVWSGYNNSTTGSLILGYGGSTLTVNAYTYGTTPKKFWISASANAKTVKYDYVDANFNLVEDVSITLTTANQAQAMAGNTAIMAVLKARLVDATGATSIMYYDLSGASYQIGGSTDRNNFNGIFTIPDGYVGRITAFYFYSNVSQTFQIMKCNSVDVGKNCIYQGSNFSNSNINTTDGLGGLLMPRDTIFVLRATGATDCQFYATIILDAL